MKRKNLVEEFKAVQAKIAEAEKGINNLNVRLTEIEGEQSAAHLAERNIPELLKQQQAIQADIALGTGNQSDLDKVTEEITKAQTEVDYHNKTVAGLNSKLADAQQSLCSLQDNALLVARAFVESEAENLHATYMEQATALLASFRRLRALSNISKGIGGNPFATGDECRVIAIPVFQFANSGQWPENYSGHGCRWLPAVDMANPTLYAQADEDTERANLAKKGIHF